MKKFIVISHTHWDREWYMTFSSFRLKLVDLIDRLFSIIESDPDYIFHLDAQTIVLEDYLEIRPENEERLKKYIACGNIRVGPWYLQNDFFLTSGESTVRNLQIGRKIAESFGRCSQVGYAPDQFGNVSQLPQIFNGFGIDTFIFGRGFRKYDSDRGKLKEIFTPAEFIWKGEDGSYCTAVHLKAWYNNAQRFPTDAEHADAILGFNESLFEKLNYSPYILLMNGVDHLEAQDDLSQCLNALREKGRDIRQYGLDEYTSLLKRALQGKIVHTETGALDKGWDYELLKGCWSSRIYLKRANVRAQDLLEHKLEPLYTYLEQSGLAGIYPSGAMNYLWKSLLKNHPHDSICGCSIDAVHAHMQDRYAQIEETGQDLLYRGMKSIAYHCAHPYKSDKNYCVAVFNPSERASGAVVRAELNFPSAENIGSFALYDDNGEKIAYTTVSRRKKRLDIFSPLNLPATLEVDSTVIDFYAHDVPPFTSKIYAIVPHKRGKFFTVEKNKEVLENGRYRIAFENALVITDKKTGKIWRNPLVLEDSSDKGDAYVYRKSYAEPLLIYPEKGSVTKHGMRQTLTMRYEYAFPANYDFKRDRQSEKRVRMRADVSLTIEENSDIISVDYVINNKAEDHRVRLIFAFGEGVLITDSAFDCMPKHSYENCPLTDSDTHCNATFARVTGNSSYAVYTEGQHEVAQGYGGLLFTVLRATGWISRNHETFVPSGGDCWKIPGNQSIGKTEGRMGIEILPPQLHARVLHRAKLFRTGLLALGDSFDCRKYAGGNHVVQTSGTAQSYYVKDKYEDRMVATLPFFTCDNDNICVTCCKTNGSDAIIRLVNLSSQPSAADIAFLGKIQRSDLAEENFTDLGENRVRLNFRPKQIITLRLVR